LLLVFAAALGLYFLHINELLLLFSGGLLALVVQNRGCLKPPRFTSLLFCPLLSGIAAIPSLSILFLTFFKIGATLYGSGYVLAAFMRADFVERLGWLTEQQLLDAIAIGQVTPGPLFTSATFIGYLLGGVPAAILATVGIFLPSYIFVAISNPLIPRLRRSPWTASLLDGIIAASLGLMAAVCFQLGSAALVDFPSLLIFLASAVLLLRFNINATWLILGGALAGLVRLWGL
jgi:chromate transporter